MSGRLALTLPLLERETAFSFMSRIASRNGLPVQDFGADMGIPFAKIVDGDPEAIRNLSEITGAPFEDLLAWTPEYLGQREHAFRGELFHAKGIKATTVKGCPMCLRQDATESDRPPAQAMALRGHWLPRPTTLCLVHNHPLVPLWFAPNKTDRYDIASQIPLISDQLMSGKRDVALREPKSFDVWFDQRLDHGPGDGWLEQFGLYPAAHFCEFLGRAIFAIKVPKWKKLREEHSYIPFDIGFQFASKGEAAIRSALHELQEMIGAATDGPKKKFGDLYDRLAHDLTSDDYKPFRDLLRDHIATTWPLGPGDEIMGEPVVERHLHSVLTASRETGIDSRRLRKLLAEAGWVRSKEQGRDDAWELFDARAAAPFLQSLQTAVSAAEFQAQLGISRSQFDLLRKDGYFPPVLDGADHKPLWDIQAGRSFLDSLLNGATPIYVQRQGWTDIPAAAQRLKLRPGEIIKMIEDKRLNRVGKHLGKDGYPSILVDFPEVEAQLEQPDAKLLTIYMFAQTAGIRPKVAMTLIRVGCVPTTWSINPKTKARQQYLSPDDIAAFESRFVTLRLLGQIFDLSWQALRNQLSDANVAPFEADGQELGALFEWSAIEAHFCCQWPRP